MQNAQTQIHSAITAAVQSVMDAFPDTPEDKATNMVQSIAELVLVTLNNMIPEDDDANSTH